MVLDFSVQWAPGSPGQLGQGAVSQLVGMTDKEIYELKNHMIFGGHPLLICRDQSHVRFPDLGHGA